MRKGIKYLIVLGIVLISINILKAQNVEKAFNYLNTRQYHKAALEFETTVKVFEGKYGKNDTSMVSKLLFQTALSYEKNQDTLKAIQYYLKCNNVYETREAMKEITYGASCNNLAEIYKKNGNYKEAESLYLNAKRTFRNALGKYHPQYALCCNNFANLYYSMQDFPKAATLFLEVKNIDKKKLGKEHSFYISDCLALADTYVKMRDFDKAITLCVELENYREKVYNKEHPKNAKICHKQAELYEEMGDYNKAKKLYKNAKNIREIVYGNKSSIYAASCNALAFINQKLGNYNKAKLLYTEAISIEREISGINNSSYATLCNNLAEINRLIGNYQVAESLYVDAKNIREKIFGKNHLNYAKSCNALGKLLIDKGKYDEALSLITYAKTIREKALGKESLIYGSSCRNLARLYQTKGDYRKAELFYIEAKNIEEKVLGKTHLSYATLCNNLGTLYVCMGKYQEAERLMLKAKLIRGNLLGKEHPDYAYCSNGLGMLYSIIGNFEKAESLLNEARTIFKNVYGTAHFSYATCCYNLASLYIELGNYSKAEILIIEAKETDKKVYGSNHSNYALSINKLAGLYSSLENHQEAEPLYIEAKNIIKKTLGDDNPTYAMICGNLASIFKRKGLYAKSEILYNKAKVIFKKTLGENHPNYSITCFNLARLYDFLRKYDKAELLFSETKKMQAKTFGKNHPYYARTCNHLSLLYERNCNTIKNDTDRSEAIEKALLLNIEANKIINLMTKKCTKFMSEVEMSRYLKANINSYYEIYHSFYLAKRIANKELPSIAYNNSLLTKSLLLKSKINLQKAILQSKEANVINLYNNMNKKGQLLAKQYTLPINQRISNIEELEEEINGMEKELIKGTSKLSGLDKIIKKDINWIDIQNSLNNNEAVLEFIHFNYYSNKWTDSTLYYALILRKGYKYPKAVPLFEEKQMQKILLKRKYEKDSAKVSKLYKSRGGIDLHQTPPSMLGKYIWLPFDSLLNDVNTVYISPSGLLNKIAFDAVPYKDSLLLSDKYNIVYTSSTAEVLGKEKFKASDINSSVLFGGLRYNILPKKMQKNSENYEPYSRTYYTLPDSITRKTTTWSYLKGTKNEVDNISHILKHENIATKVYYGENGSEEVFKTIEGNAPDILHIATHGFYFPEAKIKRNDNFMLYDNKVAFKASDNPLVRSGLLLAGGQNAFSGHQIPEGVEDGVLTAFEISNMNLFNTKLAVLSACETGLGKVKGSEGVYGLQRAFKMAGVDYIIYSLWEVPDKETQEFMTLFYKNWFKKGNDIEKAFKETQNFMKEKYKGQPYKWAAFVLMK